MSNLGGYQTITTIFKALGGPKKAVVVILGGTFAVGGVAGSFVPSAFKHAKAAVKKRTSPGPTTGQMFTVHTDRDGDDRSEPKLRVGDQYRVLERDGDAVLIDVLNNANNPYFVSGEILARISDFPANEAGGGE
ncbi:hypothetical protein [Arthrobacter sp. UYCu723]